MSKKHSTNYTKRERNAEKEIDAFLQQVHGPGELSILQELRFMADK